MAKVRLTRPLAGTLVAAALALVGWLASPVSANTLTSAVPASGSVLISAPAAISITSASALADQGSTITVTDPSGKQVDDGSITITGSTAQVGLQALAASGVYTVNYTLVASSDTPLTGTYTFIFNAPPTATAAPSAINTVIPTAKQIPSKVSHTADLVIYILLTIATLVLILLAFYARLLFVNARKRRSRRSVPAAARPGVKSKAQATARARGNRARKTSEEDR